MKAPRLAVALPRPGELIMGCVGRSARINYCSSQIWLRTLLTGNATISPDDVVRAISRATTTRRQTLIAHHTVEPLFRGFGGDCGSPAVPVPIHIPPKSRAPIGGYRSCPSCAEEDLQWFGFSYWRRRHQLPGVTACTTHGIRLLSTDLSPWNDFPPLLARPASPPQSADVIEMQYARIAEDLSAVPERPHPFIAAMRIARRARLNGFEISPQSATDPERRLSARWSIRSDASAILIILARMSDKRTWAYLDKVLSMPFRRHALPYVILIALLLSEDADEALRTFTTIATRAEVSAARLPQAAPCHVRAYERT
ncbi:TniQ family protein [Spectribacter hydrogenoxidans]|uniref:TniQ family protein n=1 Tax=Spectribacter hydrogenoxidans TaxID=3075608 RepID=UPI003C12BD08